MLRSSQTTAYQVPARGCETVNTAVVLAVFVLRAAENSWLITKPFGYQAFEKSTRGMLPYLRYLFRQN